MAALAIALLAIGTAGLLGVGPSVTTLLLPLAAALGVASMGEVIRRNAPVPAPAPARRRGYANRRQH
jgi:hypothetical protein